MHQGAQDQSAFCAVLLFMDLETMLEKEIVLIAPCNFQEGFLNVCVRWISVGGLVSVD
jgi:hypothetical protein